MSRSYFSGPSAKWQKVPPELFAPLFRLVEVCSWPARHGGCMLSYPPLDRSKTLRSMLLEVHSQRFHTIFTAGLLSH